MTPATTTFGIRLPNSGPFATPAAMREIATLSEALGFETLWVHDHLAWPHHRRTHFAAGSVEAVTDEPPSFYESVAAIAYIAGLTRRIKVGIAGLVLPWRDPRVLAKQFATLEHQWGDVDRGLARSLVGSAETIRHQIKEYVAAGVSHFEVV